MEVTIQAVLKMCNTVFHSIEKDEEQDTLKRTNQKDWCTLKNVVVCGKHLNEKEK